MSLRVDRHDAVLVMTIDRPAQRNAVNRAVSLALAEALDTLDRDPALRAGIVTGAGGNFCSGMDLKAFVAGERPELEGRGFAGVTEAPPAKPLIAALEAMRMLEDGVASAEDIDRAAVLAYRHPVGPLRLSDIVGLDVRLEVARTLAAAHGPRFAPPALLAAMVAEGRLGAKTGRGFFDWPA